MHFGLEHGLLKKTFKTRKTSFSLTTYNKPTLQLDMLRNPWFRASATQATCFLWPRVWHWKNLLVCYLSQIWTCVNSLELRFLNAAVLHFSSASVMLKVAQTSFQHFPSCRLQRVIITIVYWLMPISWYQKSDNHCSVCCGHFCSAIGYLSNNMTC